MQRPAEIEKSVGDRELAWRVLGLLNLYRLAIPSVLVALALLASRPQTLGAESPTLYFYALVAWFATGVICIGLLKTRWPTLQAQAFIHVAFDIVAVTALLLTSGGAASGAGLLLIMPVAGVSLLLPQAHRGDGRRGRRALRARPADDAVVPGHCRFVRPDAGGTARRRHPDRRARGRPARRAAARKRGAGAPARPRPREPGGTVAVHRRAAAREPRGRRRAGPHPAHQ